MKAKVPRNSAGKAPVAMTSNATVSVGLLRSSASSTASCCSGVGLLEQAEPMMIINKPQQNRLSPVIAVLLISAAPAMVDPVPGCAVVKKAGNQRLLGSQFLT